MVGKSGLFQYEGFAPAPIPVDPSPAPAPAPADIPVDSTPAPAPIPVISSPAPGRAPTPAYYAPAGNIGSIIGGNGGSASVNINIASQGGMYGRHRHHSKNNNLSPAPEYNEIPPPVYGPQPGPGPASGLSPEDAPICNADDTMFVCAIKYVEYPFERIYRFFFGY